jgi:hypothetical protein
MQFLLKQPAKIVAFALKKVYMKKTTLIICAAVFFLSACNNDKTDDKIKTETDTTHQTTDKTETKAWIPVDSAMMQKSWQQAMTIGEEHKMLAKSAGTWTGQTTMWMANGAPPQNTSTTTVTKTLYNGLYVQSTHTGNMMGMPFEGMSIMGYDNMKKEYFSTWIDNMGSAVLVMTGQWNSATKKLSLSGNTTCMNGQDAPLREVFTMIDDNNQLLEMYGPDPQTGKEYKNMEIKYTRKK